MYDPIISKAQYLIIHVPTVVLPGDLRSIHCGRCARWNQREATNETQAFRTGLARFQPSSRNSGMDWRFGHPQVPVSRDQGQWRELRDFQTSLSGLPLSAKGLTNPTLRYAALARYAWTGCPCQRAAKPPKHRMCPFLSTRSWFSAALILSPSNRAKHEHVIIYIRNL
jgi:hypothetical protein